MLRSLLAALLCAATFPALATPQPRDATDMWYDPAESGWGLNLIHQGDTLFATLFVYGVDRQPKWYVASNVSGGPAVYSGTLRECTGNWFGERFDTANHSCRDVGSIRFEMGDGFGSLEYTVDGVRVAKTVRRLTFRRTSLLGAYEGYIIQPARSGSPEVNSKRDLTIHVTEDGTAFSMWSSSDSQSECTWRGTPSQDGAIETIVGTFQCTNRSGSWQMSVDPTTEGLTGNFSGDNVFDGRIAAARSTGDVKMYGAGWRNDMWFNPGESGWGFNVIEQGDTIFGTLFVYDQARRPRWYFASGLTQQGGDSEGMSNYTGTLYESTGAWFGGPFSAAPFTPRAVGTMSFRARPDGTGALAYTVDGVTQSKEIQRFGFRKQDFTGSYLGSYAHDRQADITIDDTGPDFRMQLVDLYGGKGTCNFVAPFKQVGSLRQMAGTWTCASSTGTFLMRNATVSANGFTAGFDTPMFDFRAIDNGHIGGVRR